MQEMQIWSLGWEDPLEEEMTTHSRILAWEIPWIDQPDGLQSMEYQRVGHNLVNKHAHNIVKKKKKKSSDWITNSKIQRITT